MRTACFALALWCALPAAAQPAAPPADPITLELIMSDPDWIGPSPQRPYWADDGRSFYYTVKRVGSDATDLVQVGLDGVQIRIVPDEDKGKVDVAAGDWSPDYTRKVYSRNGDLFVRDVKAGTITQITRTVEGDSAARFLADGARIAYRRGSATLIRDLATGVEEQPADLRAEDDPEEKEKKDKKAEKDDYLKEQQGRLFDFLKEKKEDAEAAKAREKAEREADPTRPPPPFYLGADLEVREASLSPDGRRVLVRLVKKGDKDGKRDAMPQYVTESGYVESRGVRSKVGTGKPTGESLVLIDLVTRERKDVDLSVLPGIAEAPKKDEDNEEPVPVAQDAAPIHPALKEAEWLLSNGDTGAARRLLDRWIKENTGATDEERALALRLRGDAIAQGGDPYNALYDYERVAIEFPETRQLSFVVERELDIGMAYVGIPRPWFPNILGMVPDHERRSTGVELLMRVQERLPSSDLAELALYELASYYHRDERWNLAEEAHEIYQKNFSDGAHAEEVQAGLEAVRAKQPVPKEPRETKKEAEKPKPRPVSVNTILWADDGSRLAIQAFSADNKDRWIGTIDLATGALTPLEHDHDAAWINGGFSRVGWLRDHSGLWFLSERDGYSNLYLRSVTGADITTRTLIAGTFEVSDPTLSRDGRYLYFTASADRPTNREFYRVEITRGAIEQLTRMGGGNGFDLSPDESYVLITHSTTTRPPELFVQSLAPDAAPVQATRTVTEKYTSLPWVQPLLVQVPSRHGGVIHSRVYSLPAVTDGLRPAIMFVHGAGYLQNAHEGWSRYFREFMFHSLLARRGYVVLDMDYRASAGYGRDWRTAIYSRMGTPELEDLEDGVKWLAANHSVDPARVGVYGGSYGGFLALMALFTTPDLFACGAALRPVTDWAHYNEGYTANILDTPSVNPEAFARSSPIEFAAGLKNPLLICHGMQDDNVFFQDTVRLAQRLIELGKENWDVAAYPVEPHAFERPSSWLDEYRRILKLFETHLK